MVGERLDALLKLQIMSTCDNVNLSGNFLTRFATGLYLVG